MGCGSSSEVLSPGEEEEAKARVGSGMARLSVAEKRIELEIEKQKRIEKSTLKLLFLGGADAGKSTVLKQLRVLHEDGFPPEEYETRKPVVRSTVVVSMCNIVNAMQRYDIAFDNNDCENKSDMLFQWLEEDQDEREFTEDISQALLFLWADAGVQAALTQKLQLYILDSAEYFLSSLERVTAQDYTLSLEDMIRARVPTTGIVEVKFLLRNRLFRVFDVGGQRSERRKWIHCFEDVHAVVFVAALSSYNLTLVDEGAPNENVMKEALGIFESVVNNMFFDKSTTMLFLNKTDIFMEKLKTIPLTVCFQDYQETSSFEDASSYIKKEFESRCLFPGRILYTHYTCATDTKKLGTVLDDVVDKILTENPATVQLE